MSRRAILQGLMAGVLGTRSVFGQSRVLSRPAPLAKDAVTHDWPAFLGPTHNAMSTETRLSRRLPPPVVWEFTRGSGYASPAIVGPRLVFTRIAVSFIEASSRFETRCRVSCVRGTCSVIKSHSLNKAFN